MSEFVTYTTHFVDTYEPRLTLCGAPWESIILSNNPKARCEACQDIHSTATGWSFPLPEVVS
jgi:hypothetical protein